jgi:hypothetical protein
LSKSARALLVADIAEGTVTLSDMSVRQIAAVVDVSVAYAHTALHMPSAEREKVRRGLRPLIQPKPPATPRSPRERINEIVCEIGLDATLTLLAASEQQSAVAA